MAFALSIWCICADFVYPSAGRNKAPVRYNQGLGGERVG